MVKQRKNRLIFLVSFGAVFVFTLAYGYGPGYGGNLLGVLGVNTGVSQKRALVSPRMSPGDMVTAVVTSRVVTKNVTMSPLMSPSVSPSSSSIVLSNRSSPSPSPVVTMVVSPSPMRTPTRTPSVSPSPASHTPSVTSSVTVSPVVSNTPSPTATSVPATETPTPPIPTPSPSTSPENLVVESGSIIMSEIGWMGTTSSATDEWLELYNSGPNSISLNGWHLRSSDNSPSITLSGTISGHGYYLIERTDDSTINDIPARLAISFGSGGLSNNGESLVLTDADGAARDAVDASGGWFAGDNTDKTSMERVGPGSDGSQSSSWRSNDQITRTGHDSSGNVINGTPGLANSTGGF